jgi:hypothetical protein
LGDKVLEPLAAFTAPGTVGVGVIQVHIDGNFPAATTVSLKIRANSHDSNTVLLPVQ